MVELPQQSTSCHYPSPKTFSEATLSMCKMLYLSTLKKRHRKPLIRNPKRLLEFWREARNEKSQPSLRMFSYARCKNILTRFQPKAPVKSDEVKFAGAVRKG